MPLNVSINPSSLMIREGSTVTIAVTVSGDSPGADRTVFKFKRQSQNVSVFDVTRGANAPAIVSEDANLFDYSVLFNGKPTSSNSWTVNFVLQSAAGVYGQNPTTFEVTTIDNSTNQTVDIGSISATFQLVNANGQGDTPTVPTSFIAEATSPTQARLSYTAPISADGVQVERSTALAGPYTFIQNYGGNGAKFFANGGLFASTTYYYRIRSYSNQTASTTYSPYTSALPITTLAIPAAPAAVTNTVATGIDPSTVKVTWTPSRILTSGLDNFPNTYSLLRSATSGGVYSVVSVGAADAQISTLSDFGLSANTTYFYKVRASNAGGSTDTAFFSGTTQVNPGVPTAPSGLAANVSAFTNIVLTWTDNSTNELGFRILRSAASGGPFLQIAEVGTNTATYTDTNLANSTTYYYQVYAYNELGSSAVASANATTSAPRATPGAPSGLLAVAKGYDQIELNWTRNSPFTETGILIKRASVSGGPYTTIATAPFESTRYIDSGLTPNATYYYVVSAQGDAAASANSSQASATTFERSITVAAVSNFTFHPDSRNMIIQMANRMFFTSDLDRWVVEVFGKQFRAGLKPILTAPVITTTGSGGLLDTGSYFVYLVLYRSYDQTRSLPSPKSNVLSVTLGQKIRVEPPLNVATTKVKCRDIGYDISNNEIDGCDMWEIYLGSTTQPRAYLVAQLPLDVSEWEDSAGSKKYTIDGTLTVSQIFSFARRPLELLSENSLPPAAYRVEPQENRLVATAEADIDLSGSDIAAGAALSIATGDRTFTVSDYTLTDAIIYHELYLNGNPTKWEVYDVEGDTGYIRHPDAAINLSGFTDAGGSFTTFGFGANKSRVYYSGFYSGEASAGFTFSPETFPPLTIQQNQFFPDDNTDPNGLITVGNEMLVSKPAKWMIVTGGGEVDYPIINVRNLSRGSGLNAPNTMSRDANDRVYFLGDSGPFMADPSGVDKVTIYSGNAHLFQAIFDINSVDRAVGSWFSREDWFVVAGLDRIGNSGRRDGFVLDVKNSALLPFSTPHEITYFKEIKNIFGEFQLMYGDSFGNVGIQFKRDVTVHGINYTLPLPNAYATPMTGYMRSGSLDTDHRMFMRSAQTRIRTNSPDAVIPCHIAISGNNRNDDPYIFQTKKIKRFFSNDSRDHFSFGAHKYQNLRVEFAFEIPTQYGSTTLSWKDIAIEAVQSGASA